MAESAFSSDTYQVAAYLSDLQKNFIENVSESTLYSSTFGFMIAAFQEEITQTVRTQAEYANEPFPTRAKYDTNIYSHAINTDILDINAVPASLQCYIAIPEKELLKNMSDNIFTIDRDSQFYVENIEFHVEFDIIIRRTKTIINGKEQIMYTAQYDFSKENILSHITSPYLDPPIVANFSLDNYVLINCTLRQYTINKIYKKIIVNNPIDSKTSEFEFEDQLAGFTITAYESDKEINLVPVYEGKATSETYYAYFTYLTTTEIRVKFDRNSYEPAINSEILLEVYTTLGASGNFTYKDANAYTYISSEKYKYVDVPIMINFNSDSVGGLDKKSIEELKQIIPLEANARGSITSVSDLNGYFSRLNTINSKTIFYKKIDNQIDRIYYSYVLMKQNNVVIPTNTISLVAKDMDYSAEYNGRHVIKPGQILFYRNSSSRATFVSSEIAEYWHIVDSYMSKIRSGSITINDVPEEYKIDVQESIDSNDNHFYYSTPFTMIINTDPHVYISYYLMIINKKYPIIYNYINTNSYIQFISSSLTWNRKYTDIVAGNYVYYAGITIIQNLAADVGILTFQEQEDPEAVPVILNNDLKVVLVIYDNDGKPIAYSFGELGSYTYNGTFKYTYEFQLKTDDIIDVDNRIRLIDVYKPGGNIIGVEAKYNCFAASSSNMEVFVLCKVKDENGNYTNYGTANNISNIVPNISGYSLLNTYTIDSAQFFTNYTHIISSNITPLSDIIIEDGVLDDRSDEKVDAKGFNMGARELYPNQNNFWGVLGRDIATDIQYNLNIDDSESYIFVVNRDPSTYLRYNGKGQVIDELDTWPYDNPDTNTWEITVYGISTYDNTKGLYKLADGTYIGITDASILGRRVNSVHPQNNVVIDPGTNFGFNADWPQPIEYLFNDTNGRDIDTEIEYDLHIKVPNDEGSIDYEETIPTNNTKFIKYTNRFYIKSVPVLKYSYINDEERINTFLTNLENRREFINSALYVFENAFGIDMKFFNTYGPSKTFYLDSGELINKTNIVFKFSVKLEPGADKNTVTNIILAIKEYIENLSQITDTHISLLIKYLNTKFKESATYIDYEGFDEYSAGEVHINRIESDEISVVPEFLNISSNDDLTPDISIVLV